MFKGHDRRPAARAACAKELAWDRPVTDVQTLDRRYTTLQWIDWLNNRRLFESVGNSPPAEAEANSYAGLETEATAA